MESFNDRMYARGEEVKIEIPIELDAATTKEGEAYNFTLACFRNTDPSSGFELELRGDAPEITDDQVSVTLKGIVEGVGDGDYRIADSVQARIPGDTVKFEPIGYTSKVLRVRGDVVDPSILDVSEE